MMSLSAHAAAVAVMSRVQEKRRSAARSAAAAGMTARYETAKRPTCDASRGALQSRPPHVRKSATENATTAA